MDLNPDDFTPMVRQNIGEGKEKPRTNIIYFMVDQWAEGEKGEIGREKTLNGLTPGIYSFS